MPSLANYFSSDSDYAELLMFMRANASLTYEEFNSHVEDDINLFDVPSDESFRIIEDTLDSIIATLPAMKRIFSRPIIHLKDKTEIVPFEAAHVINNYTLSHAALHSELWTASDSNKLKPKKLMTIEKVENYTIYENVVFTRAVDLVLAFTRRTGNLLKDILYGFRDLHFNLLDRTHHSSYFLAIGKLHLEYAHAQEKHRQAYSRCIEKLLFVEKTIKSRLHAPVYKKCKRIKSPIALRKTNIFRSHKDYKDVYNLIKDFDIDFDSIADVSSDDGAEHDEYRAYCLLLSVFAAGHFNFRFPDTPIFRETELKARARFLGWTLTLKSVKNRKTDGLCITVKKETEYTVCILFCRKGEVSVRGFEAFKKTAKADEYLFASPTEYGEPDSLYLSLFDADSFRRIQQLILRAMIYSDSEMTVCPFCGSKTLPTRSGYVCDVCRAEVTKEICEQTGESYFTSGIMKHRSVIAASDISADRSKYLHDRYREARMHFRNITPLAKDSGFICPRCRKHH